MVSSKGHRESLLGGAITGENHEREGTRVKSIYRDSVGGGPHGVGHRARGYEFVDRDDSKRKCMDCAGSNRK